MIKTIIVEDEVASQITLKNMIDEYCSAIEIVGQAGSVMEAVELIKQTDPQLILLDIEMPEKNGFQIFDYIENPTFEVIFTTAYNEYAIKAIKMSAVDYLLKPIDLNELKIAIAKVQKKLESSRKENRWQVLKGNINRTFQKLALPTSEGYEFINLKEIIRLEANGNYTLFFLTNQEKLLVSKTLKIYADILEEHYFFRISRAHLINMRFVKKFGRQKNPSLTMHDGTVLMVSQSRKDAFLKAMDELI